MKHKAFVSYLTIRALVSTVSTVLSVAIGWHIYQITGDPFDLALIGLVQIAPILLLFMVSGWVVDQFPRRIVLACCIGAETLLLLLLAILMTAPSLELFWIYSVLFLIGATRAFYRPAQDSILPSLVDAVYFPKAVAINTIVFNVALTGGPFVAGLLIAWLDKQVYSLLVAAAALCASIKKRNQQAH